MHSQNRFCLAGKIVVALILAALVHSCGGRDLLSLTVNACGRGVSAFPLIIAKDQGLFEKYGLNVTLLLPPPENERGRNSPSWTENLRHRIRWRLGYEQPGGDIYMVGGAPAMRRWIEEGTVSHRMIIGSMDCVARAHLVGRKGLSIESPADLTGMRLGAASSANTGFHALLLAEHMGWDAGREFNFVEAQTGNLDDLETGAV